MHERTLQSIKKYLQNEEAQKRIWENMERGHSMATVTIGRAALLFGFTENQLRDWEDRGLLNPQRFTKQRQYTLADLDKLTLIRELMDANYAPGDIPPNIDSIWNEIYPPIEHFLPQKDGASRSEHLHIDQRIERTDEEVFWRYFISRALRLSLKLICEDISETIAGLVLPLQKDASSFVVSNPNDLPKIGNSLIGWLGRNRSFYTFLDNSPSFAFPSDFRVQPLVVPEGNMPKDNTLIVVQRKSRALNLSGPLVNTIRRLFEPIYQSVDQWLPCFDFGMRDWLYQVTDFESSSNPSDDVLTGLMNIVVRLGGKTENNQDHWRFSCILLPKDFSLPLHQHSLVVRAQSVNAPYNVGITSLSPNKKADSFGMNVFQNSLSFKAYQSGHIIYWPRILADDSMIAHHELERAIRSAIAVPVSGDDGLSMAVLCTTSNVENAFSEDDQRILRMISKMIAELIMTYGIRKHILRRLVDLVINPSIVDTSYSEFFSENDFISDVEAFLTEIHIFSRTEQASLEKVVSFIAIDIDNQSSFANKFGDRIIRNLSRAVGLRVQGQLRALYTNLEERRLYHVYAGRFYLLLKGTSLEEAQRKAEQLRLVLKGDYRIYVHHVNSERSILPGNMLELTDVTVSVGVTSYSFLKLAEILQRYSTESAVDDVTALISRSLDEVLNIGHREGGNVVINWNPVVWGYTRWSLQDEDN